MLGLGEKSPKARASQSRPVLGYVAGFIQPPCSRQRMCILVSARLQATAAPEAPAPMISTSTGSFMPAFPAPGAACPDRLWRCNAARAFRPCRGAEGAKTRLNSHIAGRAVLEPQSSAPRQAVPHRKAQFTPGRHLRGLVKPPPAAREKLMKTGAISREHHCHRAHRPVRASDHRLGGSRIMPFG